MSIVKKEHNETMHLTSNTNTVALVTGATGYIGGNIVRRLLNEGVKVRALAKNYEKAGQIRDLGAEVFYGDITDRAFVRKAVKGCRLVFHFAAALGNKYMPLEYFRKVNVEGTYFLAEAALEEKVQRFIHASTAWVYSFNAGRNTNEFSPLRFCNDPYCDTKAEAEVLLKEYWSKKGLPVVIVQPSHVYGPEDPTWTIGPINMIKSYTMIYPKCGKGLVQPIFIDDLVDGVIAAAQQGRVGESYLLCGDEVLTIREFFGYFVDMVGRRWVPIPSVPGWLGKSSAIVLEKLSDLTGKQPIFTRTAVRGALMSATYTCEKARREIGFSPKVTVTEGMRRVEEWWRDLCQRAPSG